MPAFKPCAGTRARIDRTPVADGQFLVATDTGEAFLDFHGVRIRVSGSSGGGDERDGDDSLATLWPVVRATVLMSDSVSGGGPGDGVHGTPDVAIPDRDDDLTTRYPIAETP